MATTILLVAVQVACLSGDGATFDPWRDRATYAITYTADVSGLIGGGAGVADGSGVRGSSGVRVWMPVPADREYQTVSGVRVDAPWAHRFTRDAVGNRFVYVEVKPNEDDRKMIVLHATVERRPMRSSSAGDRGGRTPADAKRYLRSSTRVPVTGLIATLAKRVAGSRSGRGDKIRSIYDYVVGTMRYDKTGTGWGAGDAVWACSSKYGNCTDFHSLLIGMARSQKIPARFVIGFPLSSEAASGRAKGYHCWAELQQSTSGWFPVDASEAKKSDRSDAYFGVVPSDRIEFTMGRDLVLNPPQAGEPLNFFIYPYAEVDGNAVTVPWTLVYERIKAVPDR